MTPLERFLPSLSQHPLHRAMGVETIQAEQGRAVLEIEVGASLTNNAGLFHGGVIYTLCDLSCYAALLSLLAEDENAATHDLHVSVLRAARLGDRVRFSGRVIKLGRSLAFMEAEAHCGELLLARATVTKSIFRARTG